MNWGHVSGPGGARANPVAGLSEGAPAGPLKPALALIANTNCCSTVREAAYAHGDQYAM